MLPTSRRRILPMLAAFTLLAVPGLAHAQTPRGVSPGLSAPSGGTTYLPYGPIGGGFIPYTSGPGGGLGVMTRPRSSSASVSAGSGMSAMQPRATPTLTPRGRAALSPLTPLSRLGIGFGARGMQGSAMSSPSMIRKTRPPVGGYPFQLPTTPGSAASGASPAMSM